MKYKQKILSFFEKNKLLLIVVLTLIFLGICLFRSMSGSNDFDTYYAAGKSIWEGRGLYYQGEYYEIKEGVGPFLYSPIAGIFFSLFCWLPMSFATIFWFFIIALSAFYTINICISSLTLSKVSIKDLTKRNWLLVALMIMIILDNLLMMQINFVVLALIMLSFFFAENKKPISSGVVMSLAILFKMTPLIFLPYFLITNQRRVILSTIGGGILFTLLIPTLIFGAEQNRIYHRQWLGRTVKPAYIHVFNYFSPQEIHHKKKSLKIIKKDQQTANLIPNNQSLQSTMTRLFLKDRRKLAEISEPISIVLKYKNLPVVWPMEENQLRLIIKTTQLCLALLMLAFCFRHRRKRLICFSFILLTMTLLSPLTRTHQYAYWMPAILLLLLNSKEGIRPSKNRMLLIMLGVSLYFMQAIPLIKAAGAGTMANLVFCLTFVLEFPFKKKEERV